MTEQRVRVAIVGGGRTGMPLLQDFLSRPFIEVVGLADTDPNSPGAVLAVERDVPFVEDATVFAERGDEIDLIIEVSGDPAVKQRLKDAFVERDNRTTIIVHDLTARLIISLAADSQELLHSYHPADRGIG
ncbi:MAG: hypothetical protein Q8K99_04515 [Actinomycetota bacterium]|nr:hypothetical protein [Actinomycetota bacterium]